MAEWNAIHSTTAISNADLPAHASADIAVVGAGLTGLALAYRLAVAGRSVIVLEADRVGSGASLRNAGFCTASAPLDASTILRRWGTRAGLSILRWFYDAPSAVRNLLLELDEDAGWTPSTRLVLARTPADSHRLHHEAQTLRQVLGRDVRYVPAPEVPKHIGFGRFEGALRDEDSACVNPARLLAALMRGCLSAGARIFERAPVVSYTRSTKGFYSLQHNDGIVEANQIIFATQGDVSALGMGQRRLAIPVGSFIAATLPLGAEERARLAPASTVFSTSSRFPNYFRLSEDGRLLFGGRRSLALQASPDRIAAELLADLQRVLPGLDYEFDRCWGGQLSFTVDRMPLAGQLGENVYFLGGYCGHGVPTSIACANDLSRLLIDPQAQVPEFFRNHLAPSLHPRAATFFLPAISAYYRARDHLDELRVSQHERGIE
ncbi:NAD(P)/FAD-dependent oxidoreductase [Paraburkholderia pallida]|nr:FAD-binding oxidoreductase [Paraburkholderia pallida]